MDGQFARDCERSIFVLGDAIRFESQSREFLHVEKVCALQVSIALRFAGVEGCGIDGDLDS